VKKSSARIPCAWDRRNSAQPGPSRRGAGLMPAFLRICQTVDGATVMPSPASSPWIRRYPGPAVAPPTASFGALPPQDGARGDDQPHRGETVDRQRPGQQGKQRPVRPRQPGASPRPLTPGDSELVAQHEDLGVLPPRLLARQAQQRHGTGNDQEDQLQAHKPKIIPPPVGPRPARYLPNARPRSTGPLPRWYRFSAPSGHRRPHAPAGTGAHMTYAAVAPGPVFHPSIHTATPAPL
jgi:hypothetical protein